MGFHIMRRADGAAECRRIPSWGGVSGGGRPRSPGGGEVVVRAVRRSQRAPTDAQPLRYTRGRNQRGANSRR